MRGGALDRRSNPYPLSKEEWFERMIPMIEWKNLDALMDCMTEIREDCEIEFTGLSELTDNLMEYAERFLTTLHLAAFENHHITLLFREEPASRSPIDG